MNSLVKYRLLYYIASAVTALPVIIAILSILNWPVVAEIALGVALFIHSLVLARSAKKIIRYVSDSGLLEERMYPYAQGYNISEEKRTENISN